MVENITSPFLGALNSVILQCVGVQDGYIQTDRNAQCLLLQVRDFVSFKNINNSYECFSLLYITHCLGIVCRPHTNLQTKFLCSLLRLKVH